MNDASIALQVCTWIDNWCRRHWSSFSSRSWSGTTTAAATSGWASIASAVAACFAFVLEQLAQQTALLRTTAAAGVTARSSDFASAARSSATATATSRSRFATAARISDATAWFARCAAAIAALLANVQLGNQSLLLAFNCLEQL